GSSDGERSRARGAPDGHVIAHDLADGHEAEGEEEQDEGNRSAFHQRLTRLPAPHGPEPGWKRSMVCAQLAVIGSLVNGGTGTGTMAGAQPRSETLARADWFADTVIGAAEGSSFCQRSSAARFPSARLCPARPASKAPSLPARPRLVRY